MMKRITVEYNYRFGSNPQSLLSATTQDIIRVGDVFRREGCTIIVDGFAHINPPNLNRNHVDLCVRIEPDSENDALIGLEFTSIEA